MVVICGCGILHNMPGSFNENIQSHNFLKILSFAIKSGTSSNVCDIDVWCIVWKYLVYAMHLPDINSFSH